MAMYNIGIASCILYFIAILNYMIMGKGLACIPDQEHTVLMNA